MRILLFLLSLFTFLSAQTYEEYLRSQQEAFSSFKEKRDREFSDYLNKEWKAYKESQGLSAYEEPKPLALPKAEVRKPVRIEKKVRIAVPKAVSTPKKRYTKIIIPPASQALKTLYINYFGVDLSLHYDRSVLFSMRSVSQAEIAEVWKQLANSKYKTILDELNEVSQKLRLNDWARYLLVRQVAEGIYTSENSARLFSWFVLLKMGYDVRVAYTDQRIILLLPVKGELYSTVYYDLKGRRYYAVDYYAKGRLGPLRTYDKRYFGADKALDFSLEELPLLFERRVAKSFTFTHGETKPQRVHLTYDKNLLHFFQSYPQVSYKHYFFAPDAYTLDMSIKAAFEPILRGKSQSEALDIILAFVQKAFKYKVDQEQFDREKVMFASETLFYPYSDCEDRAILFTHMVRLLLGLDVIGVKYPNHMATAVHIQEKVQGEYVSFNDKSYIIADPTYINATLGLSMPKYARSRSYILVSKRGKS